MVRENLQAHGRWPEQVVIKKDVPETLAAEVSRHLVLIAIANLLKNAFEAFSDGPDVFRPGTITITARFAGDESVEIVVRDNGMGICEEDLQEIMDFVPGKTSKKNWGTGFGLPIAQRNLVAHGGNIGIRSKTDQGTTVTITLPIEQDMGGEYEL
jgi:signal transduction histidine kinase